MNDSNRMSITHQPPSEFIIARKIRAGEQIAVADKVPTTVLEDSSNAEYLLGELAEVNERDDSDTTSEWIDKR